MQEATQAANDAKAERVNADGNDGPGRCGTQQSPAKLPADARADRHTVPENLDTPFPAYPASQPTALTGQRKCNSVVSSEAGVAQWLERHVANVDVVSSNLIARLPNGSAPASAGPSAWKRLLTLEAN